MIVDGILCLHCADRIWSRDRHDFRWCKCGKVAVDGGRNYLKIVGSPLDWEQIQIDTGAKGEVFGSLADYIPVSDWPPKPKPDRDSWCTPKWLTDLLPTVTLDPCSNERSTVKAHKTCRLDLGEDGLLRSWKNCSVFCNPPYSDVMPWAEKTRDCGAFIFLVNNASTTKWWRELVKNGGKHLFLFDKRIQFEPPPGVEPSSNSRDQVLLCDLNGRKLIGGALDHLGTWWMQE